MLEARAEKELSAIATDFWLRSAARLRSRVSGPEGLLRVMTLALLLTGLWLRARGYVYQTIPLWLDEAYWATQLFEQPLLEHLIRPPGFMAVSQAMTSLFTRSEAGLRFLPWAAGVGALFITPTLAKQLFNSGSARLLCVAAIALHPAAIDLSKEFKPYSLSLLLHLALIGLTLRYVRSGKSSHLAWLCAVLLPAVLFAQDVLFAYPAVFSLTVFEAFRARRIPHLICIVLVALAAFGLLLSMYFLVWNRLEIQTAAPYWGERYNVFYLPSNGSTYARWFCDRYFEITGLPGQRAQAFGNRKLWSWTGAQPTPFLRGYDYLWFALHIVGVLTLALRRRFREAALLCSPLLLLAIANFMGLFPMASFRADFFLVAYVVAIASFAFERSKAGTSWLDPLPATLLLVVPLLLFERHWHKDKHFFANSSVYPKMFSSLLVLQGSPSSKPEKLLLDDRSCIGWRYYVQYHPEFSANVGSQLLQRFSVACLTRPNERKALRLMLRRADPGGDPESSGWAVLQTSKKNIYWGRRTLPRRLKVVRTRWFAGGRQAILEIKRRVDEAPAEDAALSNAALDNAASDNAASDNAASDDAPMHEALIDQAPARDIAPADDQPADD